MSKRQKATLVEPQTLQEARQSINAAKVQKFFPANDDFAGGTFNGVVEGVDGKIAQEDGSILSGVFYRIRHVKLTFHQEGIDTGAPLVKPTAFAGTKMVMESICNGQT